MYDLARGALFALDAELAHELTLTALARMPRLAAAAFAARAPDDPVEILGLQLKNRVGLAAGLDKNGVAIEAFQRMGFGFVEVGTVTPRPQPGNPKPRMFRLAQHEALINRLGFNNHGVDALLPKLRAVRGRVPVGVNIGKNFDTPIEHAGDDYEHCLRKVYPHAAYVTVNISSPNTRNLRDLQGAEHLGGLLRQLAFVRDALAQDSGRRVPLLVKIAPDLSTEELRALAETARECGMDGIIATNTTIQRPGLRDTPLAAEVGGLSGAPVKPLALAALRAVRAAVGRDYPLIGVGGIVAGADARERREAGADLVQVYTGFIYRGPALVADCARAMAARVH
ncbi:MAG TPA: quinone-dependent dihydroorotate dehydrogenase [Candidatus Binatia bacterium]|nr:quinone-dependent dihydroorotate dehydrogenase [Candidatus Binatia bacterium]